MAWENASLSWFRRFLNTLGATFLPEETARAAAEGSVGPALRFALLSSLPWTALWGIIVFTHTLQFGPAMAVRVLHEAGLSMEADVARATAIGVAFSLVYFLAWSVPFASLLKAFSREPSSPEIARAGLRAALYRVWVIPFGLAVTQLCLASLPEKPPAIAVELTVLCFEMLPRILVAIHCHATARYFGLGSGSALIVACVPMAVEWAAGPWIGLIFRPFLPSMPDLTPAAGGS
jgi:hypothetical protein